MNKLRLTQQQVIDAREAVEKLAATILDAADCTREARRMCKYAGAHLRRRVLAALPVTGTANEIEVRLLGVVDDALRELVAKANW